MKGAVKTNFRGLRALVIHADDSNGRVLADVLGKLGLDVDMLDPQGPALTDVFGLYDVVFADVDVSIEGLAQATVRPCIALIGTEAPSHLARVVRQGCASHIMKPIRHSGVFTALLLAVNGHEKRQKTEHANEGLRRRLAGRRLVTTAVLELMVACGINQDEAYESLRAEAMNRRISIEELAREQLAHDRRALGPDRRPRAEAESNAENDTANRKVTK